MEPIDTPENFEEAEDMPIQELEDGSVIINVGEDELEGDSAFDENLAEQIPKPERYQIASDIIESVERDKKSREKRQHQYEEGIRRTGLGDDAPGGAQFNGASRVVHPMLAEACVDFEARAIKELLPSGGPVRTNITSDAEDEILAAAEVKRDVLNAQLTRLIPEYRDELESLLSQLPMGGSQYMKVWDDGKRKRVEFVPVDHLFLPFNVTNFYSSPRITHQQFITRNEFEARIRNGLYVEPDNPTDPDQVDRSIVDVANDKIEGKEDSGAYNEDGLREVYESYLDYDFTEWDDLANGVAPYIAHIDVFTNELLGVYRNWAEKDEDQQRLDWLVDWGFIPWRGAYKLGLPHLIGSLSAAATGALRALLDSAHAANAPTLLKLRAGRLVGQTTEVAVTQVQEIEGPAGIDDIRKLVSPIPFSGPNPVLFQLLGAIVETGRGVVATAEEKIADVSDRMPVGTALAMIEQGSKVFSAIHMRLHASQAKLFEILCRLNSIYPEEERWERAVGRKVDPRVFDHTDDIAPVSDPNIFSEAQRFAQMQAVMQLMQDPSIPYNRVEGHRRMLRLLSVPNPDSLLPEPPKPRKANAVEENMFSVSGIPLKAYPDQDHLAHVEVHLRFILSPLLGAGPLFSGQQIAPLMAHIGEHMAMHYPKAVTNAMSMAVGEGALLPDTPQERAQAVGMAGFDMVNGQQYQQILQMLQQAQQIVQSKMPQPPMDPQIQATMQIAQMEDARAKAELQAKTQLDQAKLQADIQLSQAKIQSDMQKTQAELQLKQQATMHDQKMDQMKMQMEMQIRSIENQLEMRTKEMSQQVEMAKNEADNQQKQMTELLKNRDDNQTKLLIEQMKQELASVTTVQRPQQDDSVLKEMQRLLGALKEAKTNQALETIVGGLQAVIQGQQQHQERMVQAASNLLRTPV
jgi:hypothetical protein